MLSLYLLLQQRELLMPYEIELARLKSLLGLTEGQYKLYTNFRKAVLFVAQQELKENAKWYFKFEEIKYSRRVNALRFSGVEQPRKAKASLYGNITPAIYDAFKRCCEKGIPIKLELQDGQLVEGKIVNIISKRRKYLHIDTGEKKLKVELSQIVIGNLDGLKFAPIGYRSLER